MTPDSIIGKKWLEKSIHQRMQWYANQLGSLANYLEGKEPYSFFEASEFMASMQQITTRLKLDGQLAASKIQSTNRELLRYLATTAKVSNVLPSVTTPPPEWLDCLYNGQQEILAFYKSPAR